MARLLYGWPPNRLPLGVLGLPLSGPLQPSRYDISIRAINAAVQFSLCYISARNFPAGWLLSRAPLCPLSTVLDPVHTLRRKNDK